VVEGENVFRLVRNKDYALRLGFAFISPTPVGKLGYDIIARGYIRDGGGTVALHRHREIYSGSIGVGNTCNVEDKALVIPFLSGGYLNCKVGGQGDKLSVINGVSAQITPSALAGESIFVTGSTNSSSTGIRQSGSLNHPPKINPFEAVG
jgi:hypothetical protein